MPLLLLIILLLITLLFMLLLVDPFGSFNMPSPGVPPMVPNPLLPPGGDAMILLSYLIFCSTLNAIDSGPTNVSNLGSFQKPSELGARGMTRLDSINLLAYRSFQSYVMQSVKSWVLLL